MLPPCTNRGAENAMPDTNLAIDWGSITFKIALSAVQFWVNGLLNCGRLDWAKQEHGGLGYSNLSIGPGGARLYWGGMGNTRRDIHLILPGKACRIAGPRMARFLRWAAAVGGKPTRMDIAYDDYERSVSVGQVALAVAGA